MQIAINNFKGIKKLPDLPIRRITVFTGANSGGKSSIIHLLLLIKQSIETNNNEMALKLNKPYVSLGRFENIVNRSNSGGGFSFEFTIEPHEMTPRLINAINRRIKVQDTIRVESIKIFSSFQASGQKIVVAEFVIKILINGAEKRFELKRNSHGKSYMFDTNDTEFFSGVSNRLPSHAESVDPTFDSIFPGFINIGSDYHTSFVVSAISVNFKKIFDQIRYIGPLREEPKQFYFQEDEFIDTIGNKGENAPFVLYKHYEEMVTFNVPEINENGVLIYTRKTEKLINALNYWICDRFQMAKKIDVKAGKTSKSIHSIEISNFSGARVPITHVGFGVSQILPILVEGLRSSPTPKIIILEQPEIHLHPKVQSLLFDFILSTDANTSFIIETHSDHFINRLRRRIAESESDDLISKVNLLFSTPGEGGSEYQNIKLNSIGGLFQWPQGFFDQYENDLHALIKAQAIKRKRDKVGL